LDERKGENGKRVVGRGKRFDRKGCSNQAGGPNRRGVTGEGYRAPSRGKERSKRDRRRRSRPKGSKEKNIGLKKEPEFHMREIGKSRF